MEKVNVQERYNLQESAILHKVCDFQPTSRLHLTRVFVMPAVGNAKKCH